MSANTIEIKKRNSEEVACWRVEGQAVTPNTLVAVDRGVTVVLKINGQAKLIVGNGGQTVINSLMKPGKGAKLLGGNKPYEKVEMYAIDQSSEFRAEWGLGGPSAIPAYDKENDVHCTVVGFGEYFYKIENFVNFISAFSFNNQGEITRDDIREVLRSEVVGTVVSFMTAKVAALGLPGCQAKLPVFTESIKDEINKHLDSKGLTVYNFVFAKLDYDVKHAAALSALDDLKLGVKAKKIANEGNLNDISVNQAAADVDISVIKAVGEAEGMARGHLPPSESGKGVTLPTVKAQFCPRCGTKNTGANYCAKCGEKL